MKLLFVSNQTDFGSNETLNLIFKNILCQDPMKLLFVIGSPESIETLVCCW